MRNWITSDHHFGHAGMLHFSDREGAHFRGDKWVTVEEMDQFLIDQWNSVVQPSDKVYHLGDFTLIQKKWGVDKYAQALNGRKVLIKGNHDLAKLSAYTENFKDVRAAHLLATGSFPCTHLLLTHVPVHPRSIKSGWVNVHGHTHEKGSPEGPYLSVCVERTGWTPVEFSVLVSMARSLLE